MISGGTIFSDSIVTAAEKSSAIVSISKVGRVELAPNSNLKLTFTKNSIMGLLESGSARVTTLAGVTVNITTKDGAVVADGSQATSLVVSLTKGRTKIATQAGVAELRTGGAVKKIAAGESVM